MRTFLITSCLQLHSVIHTLCMSIFYPVYPFQQQYVFIHDCVKVYLAKKIQELQGDHLYDNVNRAFGKNQIKCFFISILNLSATVHFYP